MDIQIFSNNFLQVNTYFLIQDNNCLIVDPGSNYQRIEDFIAKQKLNVVGIVLTHAHADHFLSCNYLNRLFDVPLYVHHNDKELLYNPNTNMSVMSNEELILDQSIKVVEVNEQTKEIEGFKCDVLHIPGHTPGGISLYFKEDNVVLTGDSLFFLSIGRTDFPYGNSKQLITNIKSKLLKLPNETIVYPGHGNESTIGKEKKYNPYLK